MYMPTANGNDGHARQLHRHGDQHADDHQAPFQRAAQDALDDRGEELRLRGRERPGGTRSPLSIFRIRPCGRIGTMRPVLRTRWSSTR